MSQLKTVKGMNDILPGAIERWHALERAFRRTAELHRFSEVRTPLLEHTELFVRSIGEATDVVEKEMFTFVRSDESLSMRPEGTASAARAYVVEKVYAKEPVSRWYYVGPMFRAERPQRGRYRQFHQAGCEIYGDASPIADADLIGMLHGFFVELGLDIEVVLNSLGGAEARAAHRESLLTFLRERREQLSDHSKERLERNPLRVLDSKDPRDKAASVGAPSILQHLTAEDQAHFDELRRLLDAIGVPYVVDPQLVRGLDYYTRTSFEIRASGGDLGAQNTIAGGGRYDGMIRGLGGPDTPAIGFAMGLERILLAMGDRPLEKAPLVFVAPLGEAARLEGLKLAMELRRAGVVAEVDGRGGSLKSLLRRADGLGAPLVLIVGDGELERGVVQLKDFARHAQLDVARAEVVANVVARLAEPLPPATEATSAGTEGEPA